MVEKKDYISETTLNKKENKIKLKNLENILEDLGIPSLDTLKKFELTKEEIENMKHTPIDLKKEWFENNGKVLYRKGYKDIFYLLQKEGKNSPERFVSLRDYNILGENYYYNRAKQTPIDVLNKVFSGYNKYVSFTFGNSIHISEDNLKVVITSLENLNGDNLYNKVGSILSTLGIKIDAKEFGKTFLKRLIISLKIIKSNLKYKQLLEEGYLNDSCYLRESIVKRLAIINDKLKKQGLQIKVVSGYRNRITQKIARDNFKLVNNGFNFVASSSTSPHSTGAAFDIELLTYPEGKPLKTKFEDFLSRKETSSPLYSEKCANTDCKEIAENRRLLYNLMKKAGFVGHYKEYWHFGMLEPMSEYIRAQSSGKKIDLSNVIYGSVQRK